jgi:hypothetical protein
MAWTTSHRLPDRGRRWPRGDRTVAWDSAGVWLARPPPATAAPASLRDVPRRARFQRGRARAVVLGHARRGRASASLHNRRYPRDHVRRYRRRTSH